MARGHTPPAHETEAAPAPWARWFAWGWVLLVLASTAAVFLDLEGLRMALDLARPVF